MCQAAPTHLTGHLERVNLFPLLGQRLVHAAQVVAHHAQLILIAPLGGRQLILHSSGKKKGGQRPQPPRSFL